MRVLMPLPTSDFDPTESAVPWKALRSAEHEVVFATPHGDVAAADDRMLTGDGLGWPRPFLVPRKDAIARYREMATCSEFQAPLSYTDLVEASFDAIVLPGGHAPGMKPFLESEVLQQCVARHMEASQIVAAICHGVLVVARAKVPGTELPLLRGRMTTALTRRMELSAWRVTKRRLGNYYRTYPEPVQEEVTATLAEPTQFSAGPGGLRGFFEKILPLRDSAKRAKRGFTVRDRNYLSARWPGDAHAFSEQLVDMLAERADAANEPVAVSSDLSVSRDAIG